MNIFIKMMLKNLVPVMDRWVKAQSAKVPFPDNVEVIKNIPYINDGNPSHRMDIYRPKDASGPLPVIVNLHGGGMVLCTKEVNTAFCGQLAKRGFLVFCLDYPLVPEQDVPGIIRDISRGMDRVADLVTQYGGDPDRVYQVGDSAGAILSVYAVAAQSNPELAAAIPVTPSKLPVKAMGFICGMFCTTESDRSCRYLRKDFYGKNWRRHPMHKFYDPACPGLTQHLPPCFLITTEADDLHSYTIRFYDGLRESGAVCELLDYPCRKKLPHDFATFMIDLPESQEAIDKMVSFLVYDKHISN